MSVISLRSRGSSGPAVAACVFALSLVSCLWPAPVAHAVLPTVRSRGVFTDKDGAAHNWHINAAHTLIWEGQPFLPVGGLFEAKYWAPDASELDFQDDLATLRRLKEQGVTAVYLRPARGGLTSIKPEAIQRLIDALDAEGFTYGLSISDGPREPVMGHVIQPGAFRQPVPDEGGELRFPMRDLAGALSFQVGALSGEVSGKSEATLVPNGASVSVLPPGGASGSQVVFLVPEVIYLPGSTGTNSLGMCNLWEGFDSYRDSLIALFSRVKLGKGFRFFVDPLPSNLAFTERFERFFPSSPAFANEWAAWLGRKYKNIESLHSAWAMPERDVPDFKTAADLIPLWAGGKGIPRYYEKKTQKYHRADAIRSAFWNDLTTFKTESVRGYMNDLAVVLKKAAADVPVVYRSHGWSPLFADLPPSRGFDGFGIEAYGRGSELAARSAAYVYAQASEAPKTTWLPVIATADAAAGSPKKAPGYASRTALHADLDWLREIGARGFYVDALRVASPARSSFDLSQLPEQTTWLKDYSDILSRAAPSIGGDTAEPISAIYYPRTELAYLSPTPLTGGKWWLPTERSGVVFDFGPAGRVYSLDEPGVGVVYHLWNPNGVKRRIRITIPKAALDKNSLSRVAWSSSAEGEVKKNVLTLTIGPEPVQLLNMPALPIPQEAFPEMMGEARSLVRLARQQGRLDAARWEQDLGLIRFRESSPFESFQELQTFLTRLRATLRPYLWVEAEEASGHSFDETDDLPGASEGRVLAVSERPVTEDGGIPAATAQYKITVNDSRPVQVWIAASPNAPLSLRIDGQPLIDEATLPQSVGTPYADSRLVWIRMGTATIPKGQHTLELRSDGPARVDTLLFLRGEFTPNGPTPPPILPQ